MGLLTGEAGAGKTAALRQLCQPLNPHCYQVSYLAETDFGRVDLYRSLALALGLEPAYRRAHIGGRISAGATVARYQSQGNRAGRWMSATTRLDLMTVWLVGHPVLAQTLSRAPYAALNSRIQVRQKFEPIMERERFSGLIKHAFMDAGCQQTLMSDSGLEMLRQASQGNMRRAGLVLNQVMHIAMTKGQNHLPDDLLQQAIEECRR